LDLKEYIGTCPIQVTHSTAFLSKKKEKKCISSFKKSKAEYSLFQFYSHKM